MRNAHRLTGHSGHLKMAEKIKENYYWESLAFDVAKYVNNCVLCQKEKRFALSTLFSLIKLNFAFHTVSMDFIGPLPPSIAGI